MAKSIDEQLTDLEAEIRRLKIEFDIYFNGGNIKRPPYDTKNRVEAMVKRISDDRSMRFTTRFRFNTIISRYTAFRELWRRNLQHKEEGRDARSKYEASIAAGAGTSQSLNQNISTTEFDIDLDNPFNSKPRESKSDFTPTVMTFTDPRQNEEGIKKLYESVIAAKKQCGEPTTNTSYEQFHRMITYNTSKIKAQRNSEEVKFSVDIDNGKVKFKIQ